MKITIDNYEAYLLDRAEGTISQQDKEALELFLEANPSLAKNAELYDPSLVLVADNDLIYPDKDRLLRKKPSVVLYFWKISSAAAVFIGLIIGGYFLFKDAEPLQPIAVTPKTQQQIATTQSLFIEKPISIKRPRTQVKAVPQATTELALAIDTTSHQDTVAAHGNLVVYLSDNLIAYEIESVALVVYEMDNLIDYDTLTFASFIENRKNDWRRIKSNTSNKVSNLSEQLMVYVPESIKKLF